MATLEITPDEVRVRFTRVERFFGLFRDFSFPRSAVSAVSVHDDGFAVVRGMRAPGLGVPRRRFIGTWRRRHGRRTAVSVSAGAPAIRIELTGQRYDLVVLSGADAPGWAAALQPAS